MAPGYSIFDQAENLLARTCKYGFPSCYDGCIFVVFISYWCLSKVKDTKLRDFFKIADICIVEGFAQHDHAN